MKSDTSLPIVLISHDSDYALFSAENLEDFIFYKMLVTSLKWMKNVIIKHLQQNCSEFYPRIRNM